MYFKGVELTSQKTVKYCTDNHCSKSIPLCCICISPECCENSCKWFHISSGEHICTVCYNRIQSFFSYEKDCKEIYQWKKTWLKQSHENATSLDFIIDKLMPMWCICCLCKKWRQVNRDVRLTPIEIKQFQCGQLISHSKAPCLVPEDNRIEFVKKHPLEFFESIKYQPLLETVPCLDIYDEYSLDIVGISPTADVIDFGLQKCPDFMVKFNPFMKRSKFEMAAGSIDPACMDIWEHEMFPMFRHNMRPIFIGLRNLILILWAADPKRVVDEALLNQFIMIRGLIRVALLIHTIPDMLRVYTGLGYINYGFVYSRVRLFDDNLKKDVIIINSNLSGLIAASHLAQLGANVTVLDINKSAPNNELSTLKILDFNKEVHGSINNPLSVAAYQLDIDVKEVTQIFTTYNYDGRPISDEVDNYFQCFVYGFVDYVVEELNKVKNSDQYEYSSLQELYNNYREKEFDNKYMNHASVQEVYLAEIEYRIFGGAPLNKVSKHFELHSIQRRYSNFDLKRYCGSSVEPVDNWNVLRDKVLKEVKVSLSADVCSVARTGGKYVVSVASGEKYEADKIILSVDPWDMMRIGLEPGLLEGCDKVQEGARGHKDEGKVGGRLFVIRMLFRPGRVFWRRQSGQLSGTFAIVPRKGEERGFCHMFTETEDAEGNSVLQSRIFGTASQTCHHLPDGDIVQRVLRKLSCLSRNTNRATARPYGYEVHRHDDALLSATDQSMQYRHLKVADPFSGDLYINKMAVADVPRSVSCAYVTGLDTAARLIRDIL